MTGRNLLGDGSIVLLCDGSKSFGGWEHSFIGGWVEIFWGDGSIVLLVDGSKYFGGWEHSFIGGWVEILFFIHLHPC